MHWLVLVCSCKESLLGDIQVIIFGHDYKDLRLIEHLKNDSKIKDHWLDPVVRMTSPNQNDRPDDSDINLLVIHNISLPPAEFGGDYVRQLFCNELDCSSHTYFEQLEELKVSAHLFIDRLGHVTQFVSFDKRAWHAGVSCFQQRENCNDYSIGLELEGVDDQAYTEQQYIRLIIITDLLMDTYPHITADRIVGHSTIAPMRKTDPGPAFDWRRYRWGLAKVRSAQ